MEVHVAYQLIGDWAWMVDVGLEVRAVGLLIDDWIWAVDLEGLAGPLEEPGLMMGELSDVVFPLRSLNLLHDSLALREP